MPRVVFYIKSSVMFVCNIYFLALAENADLVEDVTVRLPAELSMDVLLIHECITHNFKILYCVRRTVSPS
jgi:hypothetical protein